MSYSFLSNIWSVGLLNSTSGNRWRRSVSRGRGGGRGPVRPCRDSVRGYDEWTDRRPSSTGRSAALMFTAILPASIALCAFVRRRRPTEIWHVWHIAVLLSIIIVVVVVDVVVVVATAAAGRHPSNQTGRGENGGAEAPVTHCRLPIRLGHD